MKFKTIIACIVLSLLLIQPVYAEPYEGYTYNSYGEVVNTPNVYLPDETIQGIDLGVGHFNKPSDMFKDKYDNIYILDSGNKRVVVLDKELKLKRVIDNFTDNGKAYRLSNPQGIFVNPQGEMYIADTENNRIIIADQTGKILKKIERPNTDLISQDIDFNPAKIVVNSIGTMFVECWNINKGFVEMDSKGNFIGFYGANQVATDDSIKIEQIWKKFSTKAQKAQRTVVSPIEYSNLTIDDKDFVYASSAYLKINTGQIRKFNPSGTNILADVGYGDELPNPDAKRKTSSQFSDVTVDDDGFIFACEKKFGNIFMYDQKSDLLGVFSGVSNVPGNFKEVVALENIGDKILALDDQNCNITIFSPTTYGKYIRQGVMYQDLGQYDKALEPWRQVQKLNTNYEMAYVGIGRALYLTGDYQGAMKNFKLGNDKTWYSSAKKEHRTEVLRRHFGVYVCLFIGAIIAIKLLFKYKSKIRELVMTGISAGRKEKV